MAEVPPLEPVLKEAVDLEIKFLKFLGFMRSPLSWVMEAAALMAIALANGGGKPPDWQDFVGINSAGNAAASLMARLAPRAKLYLVHFTLVLGGGVVVYVMGKLSLMGVEEDASVLVPGDVISFKLGDVIPADVRLLEGDPVKIEQGSPSCAKNPGDGVYSGSTCKQGEIEAVVIAPGVHTIFGKAAHLVDSTISSGALTEDKEIQPQSIWLL
ncbi:hypothetical protein RJ641_022811 [Dillenia turbinata]|uniref:P-type ATPase A domain-containing protein n=1 Tax=Dillenia turbinata TaxID=194707 RepID=A0AAN8UD47_9MAGN